MDDLLLKAKQTLSIIPTATAKDEEIKTLINAAVLDMQRQGIIVTIPENEESEESMNDLVVCTIMMFVKGNFGNVEIKEKELAQRTYKLLCTNLSLSNTYNED